MQPSALFPPFCDERVYLHLQVDFSARVVEDMIRISELV